MCVIWDTFLHSIFIAQMSKYSNTANHTENYSGIQIPDTLVTHAWDISDLVFVNDVLEVIWYLCLKIGKVEHLCNVSITIHNADVDQSLKANRPLVTLQANIYVLHVLYSLPPLAIGAGLCLYRGKTSICRIENTDCQK